MSKPQFNAVPNEEGLKYMADTSVWNHFDLGPQLGENGSYGSVFIVTDKHTGKQYAMKMISVENQYGVTDYEKIRRSVLEYQHHLRAVTNPDTNEFNKHFIQVYDYALVFGKRGGHVFILMEKGDGTILDAATLFGRKVTPRDVCVWTEFLMKGLRVMHKKGLVHRDLHAKNILFVGGRPVIADFGQSCFGSVCANGESLTERQLHGDTYMDVKQTILSILEAEQLIAHQQGHALLPDTLRKEMKLARQTVAKYEDYHTSYEKTRERLLRMKKDGDIEFDKIVSMKDLDNIVLRIKDICKDYTR